MGNFTKISFKNLNGWIPETDVDGVDIDEKVASDISVFRFKNGFIENDIDQSIVTLPTNVSSAISAGYTLKSAHKFSHSVQGDKTIYILWDGSALSEDRLRIYLDNALLDLAANGISVEYSDEPNNINYNLVNDELKINLNCNAVMSAKPVILNLSLQYLEDRIYSSTYNVERLAGWYICPRWLGWSLNNDMLVNDPDTTNVEDFEDTTYKFSLSLGDFIRTTADKYQGSYSIYNPSVEGDADLKYITITASDVTVIDLYAKSSDGTVPNIYINVNAYGTTWPRIVARRSYINEGNGWYRIWFDVNAPGANRVMDIVIEPNKIVSGDPYSTMFKFPTVYIDNLTVSSNVAQSSVPSTRYYIVLAKYFDGQRALVDVRPNILNKIVVNEDLIDWRISGYEVYRYNVDNAVHTLLSEIPVNGDWDYTAGELSYTFPYTSDEDSNITLAFRYNLPATTRVDNQSLIYSEVSYKGRVYFIKEDFKVYQSHIAGNGVIQPDSFPYDESQGFGYFVVSRTKKNMALAISTTNDLVVITDRGMYVYYIQPSGSTVFRTLRMVSGSIGISSRASLAKNEEGNPSTDGLIWCDDNGIYYYAGGTQQPVNLLLPSHIEYWRNISTTVKSSAVGFYDAVRQEYVLYLSTGILIIFEIPYKKFRKTIFSSIEENVGLEDNIQYFRNGNVIYKFIDTSYQVAYIESHYHSGYHADNSGRVFHASEIDDKILQEFYVIFGDGTDATATIYLYVYWDDNIYPTAFKVDPSKTYWKIPAPIIRFRKIKLKIKVNDAKRVIIRDFGVTTTYDGKEALGVHS